MPIEHSDIESGEIHRPYNWVVNNETERLAIIPDPASGNSELYKLCLQLNTGESYRLDSLSPVVWSNLTPSVIDGGTF